MTPTTLRALAARLETQTDDLDRLAVDVCVELQWVCYAPDAKEIRHMKGVGHWLLYKIEDDDETGDVADISDLNAVIALVEREFERWIWRVDGSTLHGYNGSLHVRINLPLCIEKMDFCANAPTPARALLAAFCLAKAELMEVEA